MAGNLTFEAATLDHVAELLLDLRPLDRQEVEAASGDVEVALRHSIRLSADPVAARTLDGGLVAIFGIVPLTVVSDTAAIWLLGTSLMRRHPREVIVATRRYVDFVREHHPRLVNYVDARNRPSVQWLKAVGFTLDPPAPFGVAGLPFHRFHMGIDDV